MAHSSDTSKIAKLFSALYGLELKSPGALDKHVAKIPGDSMLKSIIVQAKAQAIADRQMVLSKSSIAKVKKAPQRDRGR